MKPSLSKAVQQLGLVLLSICIGTVFDWMAHHSSDRFSVPSYYFRNKIIFGTVIGFVALQILLRFVKDVRWLAFWSMLTVSILLQVRYYLEAYDLTFVILFMGIHFVVFFVPAYLLFRMFPHSFATR